MNGSTDELEALLRGDLSITNTTSEKVMDEWYRFLLSRDDVELVEMARLTITALGFRLAGFDTSPLDGASKEGLVYGSIRVLDLMKESLDGN